MTGQELIDRLALAFEMIGKMARAELIMLDRIASLEATVAALEADAVLRKAQGKA